MVFLKGYQWPFDCRKAESGSSVIDLLVYRERVLLGRRVYLDFRSNPFGLENIDFNRLDDAAADYLKKAQADFGTPIERLSHMNAPAIELYREKGVDITKEMLEIALCAQHNNGGLAVDMWWQTNVSGLFAAGEVAGTHGVYRPGGSALNAGQVGSLRAAQYISERRRGQPSEEGFEKLAEGLRESRVAVLVSDLPVTGRDLLFQHGAEPLHDFHIAGEVPENLRGGLVADSCALQLDELQGVADSHGVVSGFLGCAERGNRLAAQMLNNATRRSIQCRRFLSSCGQQSGLVFLVDLAEMFRRVGVCLHVLFVLLIQRPDIVGKALL